VNHIKEEFKLQANQNNELIKDVSFSLIQNQECNQVKYQGDDEKLKEIQN
jgi:hypothetical protein